MSQENPNNNLEIKDSNPSRKKNTTNNHPESLLRSEATLSRTEEDFRDQSLRNPPREGGEIRAGKGERHQLTLGIFKKLRLLIFKPSHLFEVVKNEKILTSIRFYFIMYGSIIIISALVSQLAIVVLVLATKEEPEVIDFFVMGVGGSIFKILYNLISVAVFLIISSAMHHLLCYIFKANKPFFQTLKVIAYAQFPSMLLYLITAVVGLLPLLNYLIEPSYVIGEVAFVVMFLISLMLGFIIMAWGLILKIKGFKKVHELNNKKTLFISLIPTLLLVFFVLLALAGLYYAYYFYGAPKHYW